MAVTQFVGRRGEMERLGRVLRGDAGAAGVVVVTGDAGIGKTRLLAEVIQATPDVLVLAGGCLPMTEPLPYGAVSDALASLVQPERRPVLDRALSRCAPYVRPEITALIPALLDDTAASSHSAADRTRLFAAVRDLFGALGAQRRTVLAVEDLHWADEGTLDLLMYLVRGMPDGAALVMTSRRDELAAGDRTFDWLGSTVRVRGVESLALTALSNEDVETLVTSLVDGEALPSFMADVLRRGEGNPFFTEQLVVAAHDAAPTVEVPAGVPAGVEPMLLSRIRSVSTAATEVAAALSVASRPLAEPELTACTDSGVDVVEGLRELLDAHLAEESEAGRYRLRHALLEEAVRGTLLASGRQHLHAAVAQVLAGRGGESPAEIAAHWARAEDRGEEARWSAEAARHTEKMYAWREASLFWRRVWQLWAHLDEQHRPQVAYPEVVARCVRAVALADDVPSLLSLVREALIDERVTADDHATGQLLTEYGDNLSFSDVSAAVLALEEAVAAFDRTGRPSADQARALEMLVSVKFAKPAALTGTEEAELARASAIAQEVGAVDCLVRIASRRGSLLLRDGHVDDGLAALTAGMQLARSADVNESATSVNLADSYFWLLRPGEGLDVGQRGMEHMRARGFEGTLSFGLLVNTTLQCLFLLGDCAGAAKMLAEHLSHDLTAYGWPLHMARAQLAICSGEDTWPVPRVEDIEALGYHNDEMPTWYAEVSSEANLWRGRPRAAWLASERALATVRGSFWAWRGSQMLANTARAAADMVDLDRAADRTSLERTLWQWAGETASFEPHPARVICAASGLTFKAEVARLRRDGEEPAWRAAKSMWAEHGIPHRAAYTGWRLAECLVASGRRRDAETELAIAHAAADTHVPLRREIEALARRARLALPPSTALSMGEASPADPADHPYGLTPRELEVLKLLGAGATNVQIGDRLYMSPKTASVHVSAILRKLGVTGRVQAATVAERLGLLAGESQEAGRS
jgi:DNA-binding CsgD family transcriptional regulator